MFYCRLKKTERRCSMELVVKTLHRLNPGGIHCLFTLLQTGLSQSQDLVPHITLIKLVRIHSFLSPVDIRLTCLISPFQPIAWIEHGWGFLLNQCIICPSSHYSFWLYFWQHFKNFWIHDLFWCLFIKRRHN